MSTPSPLITELEWTWTLLDLALFCINVISPLIKHKPYLLPQGMLIRGLSSTLISVFCHVVNIFCLSSQPTLSG